MAGSGKGHRSAVFIREAVNGLLAVPVKRDFTILSRSSGPIQRSSWLSGELSSGIDPTPGRRKSEVVKLSLFPGLRPRDSMSGV